MVWKESEGLRDKKVVDINTFLVDLLAYFHTDFCEKIYCTGSYLRKYIIF